MNLFYSTYEVYLIICDNLNAMTSQQGSENAIIDQIKKFCIANIFSKEYTFTHTHTLSSPLFFEVYDISSIASFPQTTQVEERAMWLHIHHMFLVNRQSIHYIFRYLLSHALHKTCKLVCVFHYRYRCSPINSLPRLIFDDFSPPPPSLTHSFAHCL
jgi:hypothetical protein